MFPTVRPCLVALFFAFFAFAPARPALAFNYCLLARTLPVLLVSLHTNRLSDFPLLFLRPHKTQASNHTCSPGRTTPERLGTTDEPLNQGRQCVLIEAAARTSLRHRHHNAPTNLATMTRRRSSNAAAVSTTMRQLVVLPWRLLLLACLLPRVTASLRDVSG